MVTIIQHCFIIRIRDSSIMMGELVKCQLGIVSMGFKCSSKGDQAMVSTGTSCTHNVSWSVAQFYYFDARIPSRPRSAPMDNEFYPIKFCGDNHIMCQCTVNSISAFSHDISNALPNSIVMANKCYCPGIHWVCQFWLQFNWDVVSIFHLLRNLTQNFLAICILIWANTFEHHSMSDAFMSLWFIFGRRRGH